MIMEKWGIAACVPRALCVLALVALPLGNLSAVDFLRADSNSDGVVSISDAYFTLMSLFVTGQPPECTEAGDADGDGKFNLKDAIVTLVYLVQGGDPPAAPFPDPGPGSGALPCGSYGAGEPMEDPAAALKIVEATAEGSDSRNGSLTLTVSSSGALGGVYAEIVDEAGVIDDVGYVAELTAGTEGVEFAQAGYADGVLSVGYLPSLLGKGTIPAGEDVALLEVNFCLKSGTEAGVGGTGCSEAVVI